MKAVIARALRFMGAAPARRAWPPARRRRSPPTAAGLTPARDVDPSRLPLQPRAVRHQVRPRQHRGAASTRSAIPSARFRVDPRRRHQRQGLGHRDGRRGAARGRATASARYTSPHLVDLDERFAIDGAPVDARRRWRRGRRDVRDVVDALLATGASQAPADVLRGDDGDRVRAVPAGAASTSRSCEVGLGGRLDATNVHHAAGDGDHLDRPRPPAVPRAHARGDRRREGRHHQARRAGRRRAVSRRGRGRSSSGSRAERAAPRSCRAADGVARRRDAGAERHASALRTPPRDYGIARAGASPATHQVGQRARRGPRCWKRSTGRGVARAAPPPSRAASQRSCGRAGSTCGVCPTAASCCSTPRTTRTARAPSPRSSRPAPRRRRRSCSRPCATRTPPTCCGPWRRTSSVARPDAGLESALGRSPETSPRVRARSRRRCPIDDRADARPRRSTPPGGTAPRIVVAGSIFLLGDVMRAIGWS